MKKFNRRKTDDGNEDPIIKLYWLIADMFGHAVAANILSIIATKEEE
jgi:hypothetical protein